MRAPRVQRAERELRPTHDREDAPPQRLAQRVAGDDEDVAHAAVRSSPAASAVDRLEVGVLQRRAHEPDLVDLLAGARRARATIAGTSSRDAAANARVPAASLDLDAARPGELRPARPRRRAAPRSMIATRSQTCSTSLSRCVFSSTATPRRRSSSSSSRTVRRPAGSSALVGSSSSSSAGLADQRLRDPEALLHALRHRLDAAVARLAVEADELEQLGALGRAAVGAREPLVQHEQLVGARPAREAEQLGEVAERAAGRGRPGGRAADLGGAAGRPDEPARDLHERATCRRRWGRAARRARPRRRRGRRRAARGSRRSASTGR